MNHAAAREMISAGYTIRLPEIRAQEFEPTGEASGAVNLLSPAEQILLRDISEVCEFRHREDIFVEGSDASFIYIVANGMVRISRNGESGRRQVLHFLLPGDVLGFVTEQGRHLNAAHAVGDVHLYRMAWPALRELMRREPKLHNSFLMRMAFDLQQAEKRIVVLGQHNVTQRLVTLLLELMEHPDFYDPAHHQLKVPLSRFDLGDYLGTSAETVVRVLARLEKDGLIHRLSSRLLQVSDPQGLAQILRSPRRND